MCLIHTLRMDLVQLRKNDLALGIIEKCKIKFILVQRCPIGFLCSQICGHLKQEFIFSNENYILIEFFKRERSPLNLTKCSQTCVQRPPSGLQNSGRCIQVVVVQR
jgi:hypothetical protein